MDRKIVGNGAINGYDFDIEEFEFAGSTETRRVFKDYRFHTTKSGVKFNSNPRTRSGAEAVQKMLDFCEWVKQFNPYDLKFTDHLQEANRKLLEIQCLISNAQLDYDVDAPISKGKGHFTQDPETGKLVELYHK